MTATAGSTNGWYPEGSTQGPPAASLPNQSSATAGQGQLLTLDVNGNFALNDGTVPGLISGGVAYPTKQSVSNPIAGAEKVMTWYGFGGMPFSTGAGDGFTTADIGGVPAFIATENTIGRKSNVNGNNRSIAGMVYGLNDDGTARFWGGPMAQAHARAMLLLNSFPLASHGIADAAASTQVAERAVSFRPKIKGTILDVSYLGSALVVGDTDYVTASLAKRDGAGGGPVVLATYDSRAAGNGAATAFVPKALTISVVAGALFLLETDIVTITTVKGGAGQVLTGAFLLNGKAI